MTTPSPFPPPKTRNPRTQALIRRDVIWQIALPLVIVLMGLVTLGWLVASPAGAATRSPWADVSLVFLICPAAIMGLVALTVVVGVCLGLGYGLRELPYFFKRAQDGMVLVAHYTQHYASQVAEVFLRTRSGVAAGQKTAVELRALFTKRRRS
jgi:hypothetical protein